MHRPRAAFVLTFIGLVFYLLSLGLMREVHPMVISASFGTIAVSIIWFALSVLSIELAFEFHARRTTRRTASLIAVVLLLDVGSITTGAIGLWLAMKLPHSAFPYALMHGLLAFVWFGMALVLFGAALHIMERHTKKRKVDHEDQAKRLPKGNARRDTKPVEKRRKGRKSRS